MTSPIISTIQAIRLLLEGVPFYCLQRGTRCGLCIDSVFKSIPCGVFWVLG